MKPYHAILVFLVLLGSAVLSGVSSYGHTRDGLVSEMNQALALTLQTKQEGWITPDTIHDYRRHLKTAALREHSFVYYAMDNQARNLCSDRMRWRSDDRTYTFQGYADLSSWAILGMSDQRLSASLSLLAVIWMVFVLAYFRKHREGLQVLGNIVYHVRERAFYDLSHRPIALTPMQEQLMELFFSSPGYSLSKSEICDALWPNKPDASETLYTLIRRIKPIVEEQGRLRIVSDRGKAYRLTVGG